MAYRTITLPAAAESTCTFEYVIGRWMTKISGIGVFENHIIGTPESGNYDEDRIRVTPADIRRTILMSDKCPAHVKNARAWDKPPPEGSKKRSDPGPRSRGFAKLCGQRVVSVDATASNLIHLEDELGGRYNVSAEVVNGIPVLSCEVVTDS